MHITSIIKYVVSIRKGHLLSREEKDWFVPPLDARVEESEDEDNHISEDIHNDASFSHALETNGGHSRKGIPSEVVERSPVDLEIISPKVPFTNVSRGGKRHKRYKELHVFCVEDPFDVSHDIGRVVDEETLKVLQDEFIRAYEIIRSTVCSVYQCHLVHVVHRDLKPENFVFENDEENCKLKLVDFGLANIFSSNNSAFYTLCGSPSYIAPEILFQKLILLKDEKELFYKIKREPVVLRGESWNNISDEAKDLVLHMLCKDPNLRPSIDWCYNHPWIRQRREHDAVVRRKNNLPMTLRSLQNFDARDKRLVKKVEIVNRLSHLAEIHQRVVHAFNGGIPKIEISHHLAHAWSVFPQLPMAFSSSDGLILVMDGMGDASREWVKNEVHDNNSALYIHDLNDSLSVITSERVVQTSWKDIWEKKCYPKQTKPFETFREAETCIVVKETMSMCFGRDGQENVLHLNCTIIHLKKWSRESFRPFAPTVLYEKAQDVFEACHESIFDSCLYMSATLLVKDTFQHKIPAVVHEDNTSRVQVLQATDNPFFYQVILAFEKYTNIPLILNTSFNRNAQPIVESPRDALEAFLYPETAIDWLILEDKIIGQKMSLS
eukprot:jgi/Galph1/1293/GphlegSOOS_G6120.1